jgi:hypothetical protein
MRLSGICKGTIYLCLLFIAAYGNTEQQVNQSAA